MKFSMNLFRRYAILDAVDEEGNAFGIYKDSGQINTSIMN